MKTHRFCIRLDVVFVIVLLNLSLVSTASAAQYKVLHAFGTGTDGGGLYSGVAFDRKGNLYGVTSGGGAYGDGTVYKLKPQKDGTWAEKILRSFRNGDPDGQEPDGTLIFDATGNLYGTTQLGGAHHAGTAFEMSPGPAGWTFNVLYDFCALPGCSDSGSTSAGLVMFDAHHLYGVSSTVFELSSDNGVWTENALYTFCSQPDCRDGTGAYAGLIFDNKGNLYGTTSAGGTYPPACPVSGGCGVVFKLKPLDDGTWKYRVLHRFAAFPHDGQNPGSGALTLDNAGSLYGTTAHGGTHYCYGGCGTVFNLTPQPNGHWKETILHNFKKGSGGSGPGAGVVFDKAGNLYGTTVDGGTDCDCGVVYRLSPNPDGTWTYSVLHRFTGYDGAQPAANLILDEQGNLYGTAITGGDGGYGVVFEIKP